MVDDPYLTLTQFELEMTFCSIAIPAQNEATRIESCLAALVVQRDSYGAPIKAGCFEILIYVNNTSDNTAELVQRFAPLSPHPIILISETLPAHQANAGWARKRAMDLALNRLAQHNSSGGVIMTTDADSRVGMTWFAANILEIETGADCVAGYIDAIPQEIVTLGSQFLSRGRAEDWYLRAIAEIYAVCDPRPHDPWPNHRVSSGASLAVTSAAYVAVGGLPPEPLGEDAAFTKILDRMGFRVRHSMEACVHTSCRFDSRARGGAGDTMQHRHLVPDAPCDEDMEPAFQIARKALIKGRLRRLWSDKPPLSHLLSTRLGFLDTEAHTLLSERADLGLEDFWQRLSDLSPVLKQKRTPLRPSDLPNEIRRAELIIGRLRKSSSDVEIAPSDKLHRAGSIDQDFA